MSDWQLTVGLEIHIELKTKSKMFCGCKNDPFHSEPNANVCPVCYGLPGALPLLNKEAIKSVVTLGTALGGEVAPKTFWARKNYFYPDLPKGYQISQSTSPLVEKAILEIDGQSHRIHRIHLEEDAGKLTHSIGKGSVDYFDRSREKYETNVSFVDYNRAGVPLLELVTEPDFHSAESAKVFCQELQRVVRTLDLSDADMEKGQMRCEANISVSKQPSAVSHQPEGQPADSRKPKAVPLGTKVEVKNINSFRAVEKAILYEQERQIDALESGDQIEHETRTWDAVKNQTVVMRSKETSADYRYFPEPDLPAVRTSSQKHSGTLLPSDRRKSLVELGINSDLAKTLVDKNLDSALQLIQGRKSELIKEASHLLTDFPALAEFEIEQLLKLIEIKASAGWTKTAFAEVLEQLKKGQTLEEIIKSHSNDSELGPMIDEVISENPDAANDYKAGKEASLNFLVGKMMAKSKGKSNINTVRTALLEKLK